MDHHLVATFVMIYFVLMAKDISDLTEREEGTQNVKRRLITQTAHQMNFRQSRH